MAFLKVGRKHFFGSKNAWFEFIGPFLNDIGDNANNANNGNPKSYRYFIHSIFPLLFKNDNFNNPKSTLSSKYDTHFLMSFKKGTIVSVVM